MTSDKQMDSAELELLDMCQGKDWFSGIGRDQYNRLVVYVNYMNGDVLRFVPDATRDGKQVLTHFAASVRGGKEDYLVNSSPLSPARFIQAAREAQQRGVDTGFGQMMDEIEQEAKAEGPEAVEELEAFRAHFRQEREDIQEELETEKNVQFLTKELDRLEKICGANILGDLMFEVHDGKNAVTNLGAKYPDVKRRMQALYDRFGFDLLYDEMEL